MIYDVIIIGAGASGLFAAATSAKVNKGLILEKTSRPGLKLLMSGSGQCNISHAGSIKDFATAYGDKGKKIRSLLYKNNNNSLIEFLEKNGVKTIARSDGKIFPASMRAQDILNLLLRKSSENGFQIKYDSQVTKIVSEDGLWLLSTPSGGVSARKVIVATGGCSYHKTGSDGSMFSVLENYLAISVIKPKPALCPVRVKDYPFTDLAGISFEEAKCSIFHGDKLVASESSGLLLTHKDFSGPGVINISKYAEIGDWLSVNYTGKSFDQVFEVLKSGGKVTDLVPKRFEEYLRKTYGNSPKELAKALTGEKFEITSPGDFNRAMATAGGIDLAEIDLKTMEFRRFPGLFAIGEALDVDGKTGGYNLQFAYSSAVCAVEK